jgi:hypothetical protein
VRSASRARDRRASSPSSAGFAQVQHPSLRDRRRCDLAGTLARPKTRGLEHVLAPENCGAEPLRQVTLLAGGDLAFHLLGPRVQNSDLGFLITEPRKQQVVIPTSQDDELLSAVRPEELRLHSRVPIERPSNCSEFVDVDGRLGFSQQRPVPPSTQVGATRSDSCDIDARAGTSLEVERRTDRGPLRLGKRQQISGRCRREHDGLRQAQAFAELVTLSSRVADGKPTWIRPKLALPAP